MSRVCDNGVPHHPRERPMTRQVERHQSFLGRKRINRVYSRENRHFLRRGRAQHSNIVVLIVTVHFRLLPHSPLVPWGGSKEGDGNGNDGVRAVIQSSCSSTSPLSSPIPHTRHPPTIPSSLGGIFHNPTRETGGASSSNLSSFPPSR